jgi:AcrR family transcriptional regulator
MNQAFSNLQAQVSHNQIGQKLGRKGQETRERILGAMLTLVADPDGPPVTLTSVARAAKVRLTNLYLYFPDLGELTLAALDRVMESAEEAFVGKLRRRWADDELQAACLDFLEAHYAFWKHNARLLHLRNALADASDMRVLYYRNAITRPLIDLLIAQMAEGERDNADVATVLMTALERVATVVTNPHFHTVIATVDKADRDLRVRRLLAAEAEILTLVIRARRALGRASWV